MNTLIDYSSRYNFGHFFCQVKQGKRLSEILQKYTDSGTETTHLAGYNILAFKYVKNLCEPASPFYRGNSRKKLKIRYCKIWRCLHLMFSTTNVSDIPKRNLTSGCHLLKKKMIKLLGGLLDVTLNIYLKSCAYHPDSECCPFFHEI